MTGLAKLVREIGSPRVVVVGDVMLDRYIFGAVSRISPEAPIPVLTVQREEERPGAAGCVAADLRVLGAQVSLLGYVGLDAAADRLRGLLDEAGIAHELIGVDGRTTTLKQRMVACGASHNQQVLRVDREDAVSPPAEDEERLVAAVRDRLGDADCVVISDYAKGVVSPSLAQAVIQAAVERGLPVVVDPKGDGYQRYAGATVVTPNRPETRLASGINPVDPPSIAAAGRRLRELARTDYVLVKVDKDGMALVGDGEPEFIHSKPREVWDVTGAGDMVAAGLALALGDGRSMSDAAHLANAAAGVAVGKVGATPVTREEILQSLDSGVPHQVLPLDRLLPELARRRSNGAEVVFTNGCFDVLHAGHVRYLKAARAEGDLLVVGLNSDASVRRLKGPERPINSQDDRAETLTGLGSVDYVVLFEEDTPADLVAAIQPDVLVKGADYENQVVVGRDVVEARGGRVVLVPLLEGRSTSRIVKRIRNQED